MKLQEPNNLRNKMKYFVFEGNEKVGKSTILKRMRRRSKKFKPHKTICTFEPGSSFDSYSQEIRSHAFAFKIYGRQFDPLTFQYLAISSRLSQFAALKERKCDILISDRSWISSLVYFAADILAQTKTKFDPKTFYTIEGAEYINHFENMTFSLIKLGIYPKPDIVFYLQSTWTETKKRIGEVSDRNHYDFDSKLKWENRNNLFAYYLDYLLTNDYIRSCYTLLTNELNENGVEEQVVDAIKDLGTVNLK